MMVKICDKERKIGLGLIAVAFALALSACGDGGSGGATASKAQTSSAVGGGGGSSAEFVGSGPNGKLATTGVEASAAEREAASKVLEESFKARAGSEWAAQCETFTAELVKQLEESSSKTAAKKSCAAILATTAKKAKKAALEDTMIGPVAALRVNGSRAFAFYHGAGENYVIPMEKEGSEWKIAALTGQEAP